jgi:MFS superfamily sulfate permease-like transporter
VNDDRHENDSSSERWMARRYAKFGAIGFVVSVAVFVLSELAKEALPVTSHASTVLRVVLGVLHRIAFRLSILSALFGLAGGLGVILPRWSTRKTVALTLVILAAAAFVFVPFCWDPRSDDCRSIVDRARDAVVR